MKLLLTAAGTGTAYSYALAKAKHFQNLSLFSADTSPAELVTTSLYATEHVIFPTFTEDDYLPHLNNAINQHGIEFYLPIIDQEIAFSSTSQENINCRVIANNPSFCRAATLKSQYRTLVQNTPVLTPNQLSESEFLESAKAVAKKDGSFGGRSTKIKTSRSEPVAVDSLWTLYEYIDGREFTVDCFPLGSSTVTSIRERLETKAGVCTKTRILNDNALVEFAQILVDRFELTHPFCFQTRLRDGVHYLIDLNPRLGAGSAMSALNGLDFFSAHLALICGEDPSAYLQKMHTNCVITRQYCEYLMWAAE